MPIITMRFIKDVVATPEQKQELIVKMTDTFVSILGEVVRPFVYCMVEEIPQQEWAIAGKPMPDLAFLTGPEYAKIYEVSCDMMKAAMAQMAAQNQDK
jgi:4-oxalocrotonate tautomerase